MRTHTIEDIEYDLSLLEEKESGAMTQAALARREGMSEGHLSRRLARAKYFRAKRDRERAAALAEERDGLDTFDHDYMELVDSSPGYEWTTLDTDESSRSRGTFNVGGQVRSLRGGMVTTDDTSRTDGKPQPTSYEPHGRLKGGMG